jgi:hypothetical protein
MHMPLKLRRCADEYQQSSFFVVVDITRQKPRTEEGFMFKGQGFGALSGKGSHHPSDARFTWSNLSYYR